MMQYEIVGKVNNVVKQCRMAYERLINENPVRVTYSRKPVIADGFGGFMLDPNGTPTEGNEVIRITHEQSSVPNLVDSPVGLSTSFSLYAVMNYNSRIQQGDTINADGRQFTVGVIDEIKVMSSVYGKRAPLVEVEAIPVTIPKNFNAIASGLTGADLSWNDLTGNAYSIERKTGTGDFAVIATVNSGLLTYTDSGLTSGNVYTYRMRANNGSAYSEYTNEISVTVGG